MRYHARCFPGGRDGCHDLIAVHKREPSRITINLDDQPGQYQIKKGTALHGKLKFTASFGISIRVRV